jgi:septum formation protein
MPGLILASRSPQRRAILEQLGIDFEVRVPVVEEVTDGAPRDVALENARRKAEAVVRPELPVLGVDTVVCIGRRIYDKPRDHEEARATLESLSGRVHKVISGVCLIESGEPRSATTSTAVQFKALERSLLGWYLAEGEWRERAGGYAIQGRGAALVRRIEGDYLNVVGLPVTTLLDLAPWLLQGPCS